LTDLEIRCEKLLAENDMFFREVVEALSTKPQRAISKLDERLCIQQNSVLAQVREAMAQYRKYRGNLA
jgi:hypothetical protein